VTPGPATKLALERGRALFNQGCFFEAHEAWEAGWLHEEGELRRLLQGLIQVAAGYVKAFRDLKPAGSTRLLGAGLAKLAGLPDGLAGLSLGEFREGVGRSLAEVRRWAAGERPGLDRTLAPRLERSR
jgi:predicted metal-dependent hydrolase